MAVKCRRSNPSFQTRSLEPSAKRYGSASPSTSRGQPTGWPRWSSRRRSLSWSIRRIGRRFRLAGAERASWRCVLKPVDATHSRLMARARGGAPPTLWACVMGTTFWDPAHLVMERRMLRTIKRPAEQSSELRRLRAGTGPRLDHHKIQDRPAIAYEYITLRSPFTIRPTL